ncbi:MAG: undecaprenyl/decaprenyl-phosphate alpha-N-acetylglucosaminyl 1-phosphate transferase [Elusimicrobia bacterium]|nr:undecaprenyl/decaprenyl-phosphate alpha-N-acetylglucosaminyl 1-phosphate transferase [Elusimicrobiota bacterium]
MIFLILLFAVSVVLSLAVTGIYYRLAGKIGLYDIPDGTLKDHARPVPYAGSSIVLAFIIIVLGLRIFTHFETGTLHQLRGIFFGGLVVYVLGLLDDIFNLDFRVKFFWQIIAAVILIHYGIYIKMFPNMIVNVTLSIFWLVLVVNAVNIIDILDGLAVGVSAISALGFFMITLPTEMLYVNLASIILCGILVGFWFFNKPPAKVFMGDAGSLFVGFILASLSMGADYSNINMIGLFSPLLIMGIPLFDTTLVSCLRLKNRQPVFRGSKDHYALRLTIAGFSPWQIDIISYAISVFLTSAAFIMTIVSDQYAFLIMVAVFLLSMVGSSMLSNIDVKEK